jgi:3-deoxy-D-manno-octulosonic-acid transferase
MYLVYSTLLALGLLLSLPYWLIQALLHGKYRSGLSERLGQVPARLRKAGSSPVIWVHAVSVGELLAVSGLVEDLKRAFSQHRVVLSTTTDTGQRLARARFGPENVFYFPLDFAFAIRPYLQSLHPELVVIAETEFWPNFLRLAGNSGARIAVVNARISDRSRRGYRKWRFLTARILKFIDLFLAQSEEDGRRLVEIGAEEDRVKVAGNLKFDVVPPSPPPIVASLRAALHEGGGSPVIVCGSTVEGEEELLLDAFHQVLAGFPAAVMILAPRHPERFAEVALLLARRGGRFWRRSEWTGQPLAGGVLLADSMGELASLYVLADVAFVGGSLVPRGGHNILEPALHGVPIIVGTHTENFRDVVNLFQSQNAVRVVKQAELPLAFMELLSSEQSRALLGKRAAQIVSTQRGATQRTLKALEGLLEPSLSGGALQPSKPGREGGRVTPQ